MLGRKMSETIDRVQYPASAKQASHTTFAGTELASFIPPLTPSIQTRIPKQQQKSILFPLLEIVNQNLIDFCYLSFCYFSSNVIPMEEGGTVWIR